MATVIYGGCSVIPAPLVSFQDEPILVGNQQRIGTTYKLQITGTIVMWKGSPAANPYGGNIGSLSWGGPNNQFWVDSNYPPDEVSPIVTNLHQLYMIESKQEALRNLFASEGQWLEFQSADGSAPIKCQPKNIVITFDQGIWFQTCAYTISAECDVLYLNGQILNANATPDFIQNASETWQIQPAEINKTFSVNHSVSAVGKRVYSNNSGVLENAWQLARDYVNTRLMLGFNGSSTFSPIQGSQIFKQSSLGSGVLNFNNFTQYNFSRTEDIDELGGSYSVTENWLLASTPSGSHQYTVATRRIVDDPYTNVVSTIQGTIHGYYDGLFNYDQRIAAAEYFFASLSAPTGLLALIKPPDGYGYNLQPRQGSLDFDYNAGTINYQYEFSNTLYENDAFEQWTLSRKTSTDNYLTTFGIAGTVKGRRYDGDSGVYLPFQRAYAWWSTLSGNNYNTLYNRILSSTYFPEATGLGLQPAPVSKSVDIDESQGIVSYSLEFNNRQNIGNINNNNVQETFQISKHFSVDDGISIYSVNGEIVGLNITDTNPQTSKFVAASGYFYSVVVPNLYNRVSTYYNVSLPNTNPLVTEITTFPQLGQITYSYEFRNTPPPLLPGVLSEHIVISENNYNQRVKVIARIPIPGRSQGEILQDVNTTIAKTRSLSIEAVLLPATGADLVIMFSQKPNYDSYALQLIPNPNAYCTSFTDTYDPKQGRYSLNAEWVYE